MLPTLWLPLTVIADVPLAQKSASLPAVQSNLPPPAVELHQSATPVDHVPLPAWMVLADVVQ